MSVKQRVYEYRKDIFFVAVNISTPAFGFIGSILAAKFLTPFEFGVSQTVMLIPSYFFFMQLGVYSGLNRNIPYYQGKGDVEKVERQTSTSYKFSFYNASVGIVFAIGFWIYHFACREKPGYMPGWILPLLPSLFFSRFISILIPYSGQSRILRHRASTHHV